jgi:hypothetical protein
MTPYFINRQQVTEERKIATLFMKITWRVAILFGTFICPDQLNPGFVDLIL